MNIREFYQEIGSDYGEVETRLGSERLIVRFVSKFVGDPTHQMLEEAFAKDDPEEAFRAAHTLKGVCSNLGFGKLLQASSALTEFLRLGNHALSEGKEQFDEVREEYAAVLRALKELNA